MSESSDVFHRRFEELFKKEGWTQYKFAQRSGLAQSLVGRYLSRESTPALDNLDKIAAVWGYTGAQFISDSEIQHREPTPQEALEVLARAIQAPKPELPAAVVDVLRGAGEWDQDKIDALSALVMGFQVAANSPNQRKDAHKSRA